MLTLKLRSSDDSSSKFTQQIMERRSYAHAAKLPPTLEILVLPMFPNLTFLATTLFDAPQLAAARRLTYGTTRLYNNGPESPDLLV
jgi:hypothetical protein